MNSMTRWTPWPVNTRDLCPGWRRGLQRRRWAATYICALLVCAWSMLHTCVCTYIHTYARGMWVIFLFTYLTATSVFLFLPLSSFPHHFSYPLNFPLLSSLWLSSPPHSSPSLPSLQHRLQKEANRQVAGLAQKAHDMAVKNLDQKTRSVYRENVQLAEALSLHLKDAEGMRKVG